MNAQLKAEILEALECGRVAQYYLDCNYYKGYKSDVQMKIRAAIAKLENEPVDEIKLEEQGK